MKMYKVMMNRTGMGTITAAEMIETPEEASNLAADLKKMMAGYKIEVHCFVSEYEEARSWENDGKMVHRT